MVAVAACSTRRCFPARAPKLRVAHVPTIDAASQAPRYSDAAGVENHPQITDFVPRRYRTIVLLLMAGLRQ